MLDGSSALSRNSQLTFFTWLFCAEHQGTFSDEERLLLLAGVTSVCVSDNMYSFVHLKHVGGPLFLYTFFEAFIEGLSLIRVLSWRFITH